MEKLRYRSWPFLAKAFVILMFFVLIISGAILLLVFPRLMNSVQNDCCETMQQTLTLAKSNIADTITRCQRASYLISGNDEINLYISEGDSSVKTEYHSEVEKFLSLYTISDSSIKSCALLCEDGLVYKAFHTDIDNEYLADVLRNLEKDSRYFYRWDYYTQIGGKNCEPGLRLCGSIFNRKAGYNTNKIATFVVDYDISLILSRYYSSVGNGYGHIELMIPDGRDIKVLGDTDKTIDASFLDSIASSLDSDTGYQLDDRYVYYSHSVSGTDWILVGILDMKKVNLLVTASVKYYYTVLGIDIIVALLFSVILAFQISKPLREITGFMKLAETGQLDIRIPEDRSDEFGYLTRCFNRMMERIQHLIHEVYEVRDSEKDAQIKMLTMQMNPHFLYNTLDAINWSISLEEYDSAIQMTTALGDILRYNIKGADVVSLAEEVFQTENYLKIQKERFGNMLQYRIDVPDSLLSARVTKFILQPIVENAVIHGISGCGHTGEITVLARRDPDDLIVEIADNGNGIPPEKIPAILDGDNSQGNESSIGISNVHKRIRLITGKECYGVSIESANGHTIVRLRMPGSL